MGRYGEEQQLLSVVIGLEELRVYSQ